MTAAALALAGLVAAPPASASTVGLAPTNGVPITIPWTAQLWGGAGVSITNSSSEPVTVVTVEVATTDADLSHFRVYSLSGVGYDGVVAAGAAFSAEIDLLVLHGGTHNGEMTICDRLVSEPEGTEHCMTAGVVVTASAMDVADVTLTGPASVAPFEDVTLTGTVHGTLNVAAPQPGVSVSISRDDGSGWTPLPDAVTDALGAFSFTDTVGTSTTTYKATYSSLDLQEGSAVWTVQVVKHASTITVSAPSSVARGTTFKVSGTLTSLGSPLPSKTLGVRVTTLAGTTTRQLVTGPAGTWSFERTATVGGTITISVTWAGDSTHAATTTTRKVSVPRAATSLTITADRSLYTYKASATVKVHLGTTYNGRTVSVYARPLGTSATAPGKLLFTGRVSTSGNVVVHYTMLRRTTFTAVFPGDYRYGPATRTVTPNVRTVVALTMAGYAGYSNGYYRYHAGSSGTDAKMIIGVTPPRPGACVRMTAQRLANGRWTTVAVAACMDLNSSSKQYVVFISNRTKGARYRMHATVGTNSYSTAGTSLWRYFTFV